jgi:Domain of unknown function (DUF4105)
MYFRKLLRFVVTSILTLAVIWATAALYLDAPAPQLRIPLAIAFLILVAAVLLRVKRRALAAGLCAVLFCAVLAWWLTLTPSNDRPWLQDVAQTPWADVQGDRVTIHNVRNFDYKTETDYQVNWETRTVDLSQILDADLFMNYWGSPAIAHTILSFEFANSLPIAISIETRKVTGQHYSALLGFFRQFSLVYVIGDERDLVRVRTNYRKGEDLYLYRTRATPARARAVFLDYLKTANDLRAHPQWYNALTSNCTTDIIPHLNATPPDNAPIPWDWRILVNGYADQMSYEQGKLAGDLPFAELKRRAHINKAARAADKAPDFSRRIRMGRPGFELLPLAQDH